MDRLVYNEDLAKIEPIIFFARNAKRSCCNCAKLLGTSAIAIKKVATKIESVFSYLKLCKLQTATCELDITLARGLNYYTGAIFEVKTNEVQMGSIGEAASMMILPVCLA